MLVADLLAYNAEQFPQRILLRDRFPEWVVGIYPGEIQRRLLDIGSLERLHVKATGAMHRQ